MSAGTEFQVDGTATEKARRVSSVCMRGTTVILDIYIRRQNHEDVSIAPGRREQVRLQCSLEGALRQVR